MLLHLAGPGMLLLAPLLLGEACFFELSKSRVVHVRLIVNGLIIGSHELTQEDGGRR